MPARPLTRISVSLSVSFPPLSLSLSLSLSFSFSCSFSLSSCAGLSLSLAISRILSVKTLHRRQRMTIRPWLRHRCTVSHAWHPSCPHQGQGPQYRDLQPDHEKSASMCQDHLLARLAWAVKARAKERRKPPGLVGSCGLMAGALVLPTHVF